MDNDLNILIRKLKIVDAETGISPSSEEELDVIKIQLLAAQIIADDVKKIKKISSNSTNIEIIDQLLYNWTENIRDFTFAIIESRNNSLFCESILGK
ncbi:MAG: hypothetical protein LBB25_01915 [Holosporaceae bacterium]|jgi:hypothetical protein|nr:hypothetical protein [Holosporaceae bacterium]